MQEMKDTLRATVHIGYDGRVYKTFRGPKAQERFANEVRVLRFLEQAGCPFVPRLLEDDADRLRIVTTNCGSRVQHLGQEKMDQLFAELEQYGVQHDDKDIRNVVEKIIASDIAENQFDECDGLTFKALNTIAGSFYEKLASIYHQRVSYPGFDFSRDKAP